MPDAIFDDPRLAPLYDLLEPPVREDLAAYVAMVEEFGAIRVLDLGCGTGVFALMLAERGYEVVGVDPAAASLAVARSKPGADLVQFILCDATTLPPLQADLVTMTGNVAQIFLSDEAWAEALQGIHAALREGGRLVFETRDPRRRIWEEWRRDWAPRRIELDGFGVVGTRSEVTRVDPPFVTFAGDVTLPDGTVIPTSSTLRFRELDELEASLAEARFVVDDVRDAPDRPELELVVTARRP